MRSRKYIIPIASIIARPEASLPGSLAGFSPQSAAAATWAVRMVRSKASWNSGPGVHGVLLVFLGMWEKILSLDTASCSRAFDGRVVGKEGGGASALRQFNYLFDALPCAAGVCPSTGPRTFRSRFQSQGRPYPANQSRASPAPHLPGCPVVHTRSQRQAAEDDYAGVGEGVDKAWENIPDIW
jgi:hypothetical protein